MFKSYLFYALYFFVQCLTDIANGVRTAARITDTPCDIMHTDAFVQVSSNFTIKLENCLKQFSTQYFGN